VQSDSASSDSIDVSEVDSTCHKSQGLENVDTHPSDLNNQGIQKPKESKMSADKMKEFLAALKQQRQMLRQMTSAVESVTETCDRQMLDSEANYITSSDMLQSNMVVVEKQSDNVIEFQLNHRAEVADILLLNSAMQHKEADRCKILAGQMDEFSSALKQQQQMIQQLMHSVAPETDIGCSPLPNDCIEDILQHGRYGSETHSSLGGKLYKCRMCGKYFEYLQMLKSHMRTHLTTKLHHCMLCGKRFAFFSNLVIHVIHIHVSHMCGICGKVFATVFDAEMHLNVHVNIKPHRCDYCDKRFNWHWNLTSHVLTRHRSNADLRENTHHCNNLSEQEEEMPFGCGICGKSFLTEEEAVDHFDEH